MTCELVPASLLAYCWSSAVGQIVIAGDPICVVHAESRGELEYALDYAGAHADIVEVIPE